MAARAWATDNLTDRALSQDREVLDDAKAFGIPVELVEAQLDAAHEEFEGVWPMNEKAVRAFLAVANQWRALHRQVIGLDYTACRSGWKMLGMKISRRTFAGVQIMESEAARLLNNISGAT